MKPKLLIVELWGLGDLVIATPFLRAASARFDVTLLAKPFALDLQPRLWPGVQVETFIAPWTAFQNKYHFWRWPLAEIFHLRGILAAQHFDAGLSARLARNGGDPRDHLLLKIVGAKRRIGFTCAGSRHFLTQALPRPEPHLHRFESWRVAGQALGIDLPPREDIVVPPASGHRSVLIHSGAGQPVRVWPLERYKTLAAHLRRKNYQVQIACDPDQREWWLRAGEPDVVTPQNVAELIALIDQAGAFIGNDSGPGHLAAVFGVPTFTLFGPQLPEWFAPLHPQAEWLSGKACPYKPCSDYCRFPTPFCLWNIGEDEVAGRVERFLATRFPAQPQKSAALSAACP